MGVISTASERQVIHRILEEYGFIDKKLYPDDVFFFIEGRPSIDVEDYIKQEIEYVYIKSPNYSYDSVMVSIEGKEMELRYAPMQAVALLYGKIQGYEREFNEQ